VTQSITHPGFGITVPGPGAAPSAPYRIPPGELARLLARLDGRPRGNGGATNIPTDTAVANNGVGNTISGDLPQSIQQATAQTQALGPKPIVPNPAIQSQQAGGNTAPQVINCVSSPAATGCNPQSAVTVGTTQSGQPVGGAPAPSTTTPTPPLPPLQPSGPVVVTYAGVAKSVPGSANPALGFTDQTSNHRQPYTNGTLTYPAGQPQQGVFTATLPNGLTVTFPLPPGNNSGQITTSDGSLYSATTFLSADQTFFYGNARRISGPSSDPVAFIFGGQPVSSAFYQPTATNQFFTFNLQPDAALQTTIPFVPAQFGGNTPNAVVSPLLLAANANTQFGVFNPNTNPNPGGRQAWLQSSIAFNGTGPSQSSVFVVNTGDFFTSSDTGTVAGAGPVRGSYLAAGASAPIRLGSSIATVPDGNGNNLFGTNTITGFVLDQNDYNTNLNFQQQLATAAPYGQPATNYAFNNPVVAAGTLSPGSRTAQALSGYFGGIMYPNFPGSGQRSPYVLQGVTAVGTNPTNNSVLAVFGGTDPFTSGTSGISNMTLAFGSVSGRSFARSTFIDDTRYAAAESPSTPSNINGTNLPTTPGGTLSPRLGLVTSAVVNNATPALPAGVSVCACQYLQWGYWTGELDTPNAQQTAATRMDRANINTWLAGIPTAAADINTLSSQAFVGTYNGHVIGSVVNNGASYVAAGGFTGTYNFGSNTGTVAVNNFDGHSASGTVMGSGGAYAGNLTAPGIRGTVNGSFFGPMAAETGGAFGLQSTNYLASGIFAGKR
jgi:hypothetical protein